VTPRTAFTALGLGFICVAAPAADPDYASVRRQALAGATVETPLVGRPDAGKKGQALRTDGVVIGFDVAVSKTNDTDHIVGVRPVYRTPSGNFPGQMAGEFDPIYHVEDWVRRNGVKERQLLAKPGYAVAEIHVIPGHGLEHFSLTYARTTSGGLDLTDTYQSESIGRDRGNWVQTSKSGNRFVIGVNFRQEREILRGLGLIHLKDAATPAPVVPDTPRTTTNPVSIPKLIPVIPRIAPKSVPPELPTASRPAVEPGKVYKEPAAPESLVQGASSGPPKAAEPAPDPGFTHASEALPEPVDEGTPKWMYAAGAGAAVLVLLLVAAVLVLRRGVLQPPEDLPRRRTRSDDPPPARRGRGRGRGEIDVDDLFEETR
jgi:hypothetical protein